LQNTSLYDAPDLAQFYDLENPWGADFDACTQMAQGAQSILDLGCGTGELVARLAPNMRATGVDPAAAMLDIARARPGGDHASWVQGDARDLDLGQHFDLVVLTGHTFQVFLHEQDQRAMLATIVRHLTPTGRFVFDTRNPARQAWKNWTAARTTRHHHHTALGPLKVWTTAKYATETAIVTYRTHYEITATEEIMAADAEIKFTPLNTLKSLINDAGLIVDHWHGDWAGSLLVTRSADFIAVGRRR